MTDIEVANENALLDKRADFAKERRDKLAREGACINGRSHGPPTHGKKCAWCAAVHKFGIVVVLEMDARGEAPARPPGYTIRGRALAALAAIMIALLAACGDNKTPPPDARSGDCFDYCRATTDGLRDLVPCVEACFGWSDAGVSPDAEAP